MSDFIRELYRSVAGPFEGIGEYVFDRDGTFRKVFHLTVPFALRALQVSTPIGRAAPLGYRALAEVGLMSAYAASWAEYMYQAKVLHNVPTAAMMGALAVENLIYGGDLEDLEQQKQEILDVAPWTPLEWPF